MSTFDLVCVTNRALCADDFIARIGALAEAGIDRIILREKDLSEHAYLTLARQVLDAGGDRVVLHHFPAACAVLHAPRLHVSFPQLVENPMLRQQVDLLGVSIHAPEEAIRAEALGADYVTAGHVFATDCKRGLPGRGLDFLRETCRAVRIPVYAIGGIAAENLAAVRDAGAAGACLMSGLMVCPDPGTEVARLRAAL